MAEAARSPMLCVMEHRTVTITLQVEVDGDDVRGSATDAGGEPRVFAGWLGLVGAIDALLGFPPDAGAAARAIATRDGAQSR
jgi:hypothetical protein